MALYPDPRVLKAFVSQPGVTNRKNEIRLDSVQYRCLLDENNVWQAVPAATPNALKMMENNMLRLIECTVNEDSSNEELYLRCTFGEAEYQLNTKVIEGVTYCHFVPPA